MPHQRWCAAGSPTPQAIMRHDQSLTLIGTDVTFAVTIGLVSTVPKACFPRPILLFSARIGQIPICPT